MTFQFADDDIDPDRITKAISIMPSYKGIRGSPREGYNRGVYTTNYWGLDSQSVSESVDAHFNDLLNILEPHRAALKELQKDGYSPKFYCGIFYSAGDEGIQISPKTLGRISSLGILVDIHVYDITEDDEFDSNQKESNESESG